MLDNKSIRHVMFFGDWHANFFYARTAIEKAIEEHPEVDVFVHVGDFGFWRNGGFAKTVSQCLHKYGKEMWVIPGNHEDYDWIKTMKYDDRGLIQAKKNLFVVPRGYHWVWNDVVFCGLGGAFSIDWEYRREGVDWFADEMITRDDYDKAVDYPDDIDILVTHDAPFIPPGNVAPWKLSEVDEWLSAQCRNFIKDVITAKNVKLDVHGHHHTRYNSLFEQCTVVGLNCDGPDFPYNRIIIDLELFKKNTLNK